MRLMASSQRHQRLHVLAARSTTMSWRRSMRECIDLLRRRWWCTSRSNGSRRRDRHDARAQVSRAHWEPLVVVHRLALRIVIAPQSIVRVSASSARDRQRCANINGAPCSARGSSSLRLRRSLPASHDHVSAVPSGLAHLHTHLSTHLCVSEVDRRALDQEALLDTRAASSLLLCRRVHTDACRTHGTLQRGRRCLLRWTGCRRKLSTRAWLVPLPEHSSCWRLVCVCLCFGFGLGRRRGSRLLWRAPLRCWLRTDDRLWRTASVAENRLRQLVALLVHVHIRTHTYTYAHMGRQ